MHDYSRINVSHVNELVGCVQTKILFDSGSSLSLISAEVAKCTKMPTFNMNRIDIKTGYCNNIEISSGIYIDVQIGTLKQQHKFMICEYLVFP